MNTTPNQVVVIIGKLCPRTKNSKTSVHHPAHAQRVFLGLLWFSSKSTELKSNNVFKIWDSPCNLIKFGRSYVTQFSIVRHQRDVSTSNF